MWERGVTSHANSKAFTTPGSELRGIRSDPVFLQSIRYPSLAQKLHHSTEAESIISATYKNLFHFEWCKWDGVTN